MQIQQGDILIKTTKTGKEQLWINQRLVSNKCDVGYLYLKDKARRKYKNSVRACDLAKSKEFLPDSGKAWRWGKTQHGYYYCYDNIPDRKPTYYRSKLGTEQELKDALNALKNNNKDNLKNYAKQEMLKAIQNTTQNTDIQYYMYQSPVAFNQKQAGELAEALAWCKYLVNSLESKGYKRLGINKIQDFYTIATELLSAKKLEGLNIESPAYLRNKVKEFSQQTNLLEQRNYLISDKYNNINALIVGKIQIFDAETGEVYDFDYHQALMYNAYMNPGAPQKESIAELYRSFYVPAIQEFGYEPISETSFSNHLRRFNMRILLEKERSGADYYKKHFLTYVPAKRLQYAHSLIAGDGSGTISYKYVKSNGKIGLKKLYVMMISDVASRKIIGWSFAKEGETSESSKMTKEAVKMAMEACEFQTMWEFVSDNHKAFTAGESKAFLNLVFRKVRTIEVSNSQGNPAETEFRLFKKVLKQFYSFISSSWNVSVEGQATAEDIDIDRIPNYNEAKIQFEQAVEIWNNKVMHGATPNERFTYKHPDNIDIDARIVRRLFGNETKKDVSLDRGFVKVSKTSGYTERQTYLFEIEDFHNTGIEEIARACGYQKHAKVGIFWTEEAADLYSPDGRFIMTCYPALQSSKSHAEADFESELALSHNNDRKKQQLTHADRFTEKALTTYAAITGNTVENTYGNIIGYNGDMQTGGNKESYNDKMNDFESERVINTSKNNKKILSKRERINRDYNRLKNKEIETV